MPAIRPSHHVGRGAYGGLVRFSISLPQRDTDGFDESGFKDYLARAVRLGDAFLGAGSSTTASFTEAVKTVRQELGKQGKDPAGFTIGKRVYLMVDDDADRARERVLAGLHRIYGEMPGIEAVPVSGTAIDVVRGVREVIDAGAEMVLLNPVGEHVAEDRDQMERLAADVIPQLS